MQHAFSVNRSVPLGCGRQGVKSAALRSAASRCAVGSADGKTTLPYYFNLLTSCITGHMACVPASIRNVHVGGGGALCWKTDISSNLHLSHRFMPSNCILHLAYRINHITDCTMGYPSIHSRPFACRSRSSVKVRSSGSRILDTRSHPEIEPWLTQVTAAAESPLSSFCIHSSICCLHAIPLE